MNYFKGSPAVRGDANQSVNRVLQIDLCQQSTTGHYHELQNKNQIFFANTFQTIFETLWYWTHLSMSLSCVLPAHRSEPADKTNISDSDGRQPQQASLCLNLMTVWICGFFNCDFLYNWTILTSACVNTVIHDGQECPNCKCDTTGVHFMCAKKHKMATVQQKCLSAKQPSRHRAHQRRLVITMENVDEVSDGQHTYTHTHTYQ